MFGLTVRRIIDFHTKSHNEIQIVAGVLMWEVFTCGKMPYGRLKNTEVVERVQRGIILEKPKACAKEIYDVSFAFAEK
jgi:Protein tyrosine and serine/threonine kinase